MKFKKNILKIAKIAIIIFIFLLLIQSVNALESKEIIIQNETILITAQFQTIICNENISKVFKIERLNYTSNNSDLKIYYQQKTILNKTIIQEKNISKTINKYTLSNTGEIFVNESGIFEIKIIFHKNNSFKDIETNENSRSWFMNSSCQTNNDINSSNNDSNNNQSNNEEEKDCFQDIDILVNKNIFLIDEKVLIDFYMYPKPQNYSIKYHIEDLFGEIIKKEILTTNTNTKTHTFKEMNAFEKTYLIKAKFKDECQEEEIYELVTLKNKDYEEILTTLNEESTEDFKIINTYTRQKYLNDNLSWNIRIDAEGIVNIIVNYKNQSKNISETFDGERTITVIFNKSFEEGQISTKIIQENLEKTKIDYLILINKSKNEEINEEQIIINKTIIKSNIDESELQIINTSKLIQENSKNEKTNNIIIDETTTKTNKITIYLIIGLVCLLAGLIVPFINKKIKEFIISRKV